MNYYLIYTSRTRWDWTQKELLGLLSQSWTNNKKNGISGMLVYIQNRFIQLIEGEKEHVKATIQKIKQDPRHNDLTILLEGQSESRLFKNWSMGFKHLNEGEFNSLSGFSDPTEFFTDDNINNHSHPALIFLKLFYDKNYRDFIDQPFV